MTVCTACGAENRPGRRFCGACGAGLPLSCGACGFANEVGDLFCGGCGQTIGAPIGPAIHTLPADPDAQRRPTARSTPPEPVTAEAPASPPGLEDERKQVTVLFADIAGSTELIRQRDPEDAQQLLDGAVRLLMDAVHRYQGTVNQVMGDGIMALFGAPVAHEDHAVRACYAALDMQADVRRYAEEVRQAHGLEIHIRVGLNSGEVVVRTIGSDLRTDYSAVGQTTHLAARMEQLASPGTTRLTSQTLRLVEGRVQAKPLGLVSIKGLETPIEAYELLGVGPRRSRLPTSATRGLSRFVGRDAELGQLRHALRRAESGHGQVVAVIGEPGVGKSRLIQEAIGPPTTDGWLVLSAGCVSYGRTTAFLPIGDLLKAYCGIDAFADRATIVARLAATVPAHPSLDATCRSALLVLLGIDPADPGWQGLAPPERRRRMLDACVLLMVHESESRPALLLVEDLHWIDQETQAVLDRLVPAIPAARIMLVVSYRPEYGHSWVNLSHYSQLRLEPLEQPSAEALLNSLLGDDPMLSSVKAQLIERTQGNPFFLEESVRSLIEAGVLSGERGGYRLAGPAISISVPDTVQAILAARVDRLLPTQKHVLQAAAVIGRDVPLALLRSVAEMTAEDLDAHLEHLQRAELLYQTHAMPDTHYVFKHAITRDVIYAGLLRSHRHALHRRVASHLAAAGAAQEEPPHELLAFHLRQAEAWAQALPHLRIAAAHAKSRTAYADALTFYEQALAIIERESTGESDRATIFDLLSERHGVFGVLGRYREECADLDRMRALAEAAGDEQRLSDALNGLADLFIRTGELTKARGTAEAALALKAKLGDRAGEADALSNIAPLYASLGDVAAAAEMNRRALGIREQIGDQPGQVRSLDHLGVNTVQMGRYGEAEAYAVEALRRARDIGYREGELWVSIHLGSILAYQGQAARARGALNGAIELARALGNRAAEGWTHLLLGRVARDQAEIDPAQREHRAALAIAEAVGSPELEMYARRSLGETELLAGRPGDALAHLDESIVAARRGGFVIRLGESVASAALAALELHDLTRARQYAAEAIGLLGSGPWSLGDEQWAAWCLYRVLKADGDARAEQYRQRLCAALDLRLAAITDPGRRGAFLDRLVNRPIVEACSPTGGGGKACERSGC